MHTVVFSCGTDAMDWIEKNCMHCKLFDQESMEDTECEFSNKLHLGFFGLGPSIEEFEEYGYDGNVQFDCSKLLINNED